MKFMKPTSSTFLAITLLTIGSFTFASHVRATTQAQHASTASHQSTLEETYCDFFAGEINLNMSFSQVLEQIAQALEDNNEPEAAETCRSLQSQHDVYGLKPNAATFVAFMWDTMHLLESETQTMLQDMGPDACELRIREMQGFSLMAKALDPKEKSMLSWSTFIDRITTLLGDYEQYQALTKDLQSIRNKKITMPHIATAGMYHSMGYKLTTLNNDLGATIRVLEKHSDLLPSQVKAMSSNNVDTKQVKDYLFRVVKMMRKK